MNSTGTPENVNLPDTEVEWYDFGGGNRVAPTADVEGNQLPGTIGPYMAALDCVKNRKYYYKVIEGQFTEEDLPSMFKDHATAFEAEVKAAMTQETQ